jgi:nucleotide-binding universal stress UspA family protein
MVFLVPYDGSAVSERALDCAIEHGQAMGTEVVAVSFVPTGAEYAERRKWIEPTEDFAADSARAELKRKIEEATDDAERSFTDHGASALGNGISDHVRRVAEDIDASVLFVGADPAAENDGLSTPFGDIAAQAGYDVHLVRSA